MLNKKDLQDKIKEFDGTGFDNIVEIYLSNNTLNKINKTLKK